MAAASYSVTTSSVDLSSIWRKVQAGIVVAAQFGVDEWNALLQAKRFNVDWSAREITMELDIQDDVGTAMIPEGGKEARPSSPNTVTSTLTWVLANKRFTISKTAQYIAQRTPQAQLESQLRYQARKALQGIRRKFGDMFYGFSTGTAAICSASAASAVAIKDMYGIANLGSVSANRRVVDLFKVGDYIVALNPTGPALRAAPAKVTNINRTTNVLSVDGDLSVVAADLITFANNLENTTLAGGTERNQWITGLLDIGTSTSLHSVSGSTYSKWNAALNDSTGGRFNGIKLRRAKQLINNQGGGEADTVWWAQGVENDVVAQLQAGVRFDDAFSMEMDGRPVSKGIQFKTTLRVPDGYAFIYDSKNSVQRMTLLPEPGAPAFDDGDKLQDDSGLVFSLDFPAAMVCTNRSNVALYSGLTQL
jgi:hypothetical protein